jgi:hypothetical protein
MQVHLRHEDRGVSLASVSDKANDHLVYETGQMQSIGQLTGGH